MDCADLNVSMPREGIPGKTAWSVVLTTEISTWDSMEKRKRHTDIQ